mgnify:CR=1 FL=1
MVGRCCNGVCIDITDPPDCPPVCKPGVGISDTKIFANGVDISSGMDYACDGDPINITGTGRDTDEQHFYRYSITGCGCRYTHHSKIPGTMTMEVLGIDPPGEFNCRFFHM